MARLNKIWHCHTLRFASRFKLYKFLIISILLYGCETWTLLADFETRIQAFESQVHEKTSLHLLLGAQDQRLGMQQDQLPCRSTGISSGNCPETEICLVWACHAQQPVQNHLSRHLKSPKDTVSHGHGLQGMWSLKGMVSKGCGL